MTAPLPTLDGQALKALHDQEPLDPDGIMVGVSRQALDHVLAYLAALPVPSAATPQPVADAEGVNLDDVAPGVTVAQIMALILKRWGELDGPYRTALDMLRDEIRDLPGSVTTEAGAGEVEPVAWRWQHRSEGSPWVATDALPSFAFDKDDGGKDWFNREPLYSASALTAVRTDLARAVEAAHYANGVAELAMKHRDAAESALTTLQARYDSLVGEKGK